MGGPRQPAVAHAPLRCSCRQYCIAFPAPLQCEKLILATLEATVAQGHQRLPLQEAGIAKCSIFPKRLGNSYGGPRSCSSRIS